MTNTAASRHLDTRDAMLSDLRVLELGSMISAPFAAKLLADLGAEVIKIEPPSGDPSRREGPFPNDVPDAEMSGLFLYLNQNKLGITLDLTSATGLAILDRLVVEADILIENVPSHCVAAMGLDPNRLRSINTRLIVTSITPFGRTGPYAGYRSYPMTTCHGAGTATTVGRPDREPLTLPEDQASYLGGIGGAAATMAALFARDLLGEGQHVDVSEAETLATLLTGPAIVRAHYVTGKPVPRSGHRVHAAYPTTVLPCKDGYVMLVAPEDEQWERLVHVMGDPDWGRDPLFRERMSRSEHADILDSLITPWLEAHSKAEIFEECLANRVPTAPMNTTADVVALDHLRMREFFRTVEHSVAGPLEFPGVPYRVTTNDGQRIADDRPMPAPLLGQHNDVVYRGRLGFQPEELVRFRQSGVI